MASFTTSASGAASLSRLYPALRTKKLRWADEMEARDEAHRLLDQESLTLENFAWLLHFLVPKCELDTTKTSHHFQIEDLCVDLMYRNHLVISISQRRAAEADNQARDTETEPEEEEEPEDDDDDEEEPKETEPDDEEPEEEEEEEPQDDDPEEQEDQEPEHEEAEEDEATFAPAAHVDAATLVTQDDTTQPQAQVAEVPAAAPDSTEPEQKEVAWQVVKNKKPSRQPLKYFVFANEANASFMDYVGQVTGWETVLAEVRPHPWAHAFQLESNLVYDFPDPTKRQWCRKFLPNQAYLHKFQGWFDHYEKTGETEVPDSRRFTVFRENSDWHKWTMLGQYQGLRAVRQAVIKSGSSYGHAYCPETRDLVDFWLTNQKFRQKVSTATETYATRFQQLSV